MKVCGVDLKANDAIICLISYEDGLFTLMDCRVKKLTLSNATSTDALKKFQFDFAKLMADYQVDHVVIKERLLKGKFAGGAVSFKMESAIQLIDELSVSLISSTQIKQTLKQSHINLPFKDTGLKQFQEQAFNTAFAYSEASDI